MDGQRRYVSLLFADVCDYTALNEVSDPEDAESIKRQIEGLASDVIHKHRGAITQVYGDGILAVFGFPSPREDDARRAIEAALELHGAIRMANWSGTLPRGFEVRMHSGVHAGLVFSRQGDELHGRYQLIGDAVNTAARLCGAAARDEVLVSSAVLRGFDAFFATRPAAPITLRGKRAPVLAHVVTGRSGLRTSFEARSRRGLTSFSGRGDELEQIGRVFREVCDGNGRLVLVTGDAGIGKSRLLEELRLADGANDLRVLRGCCDSYGETGPLEPFLQVLRQALELPPGVGPEQAIAAVDSQLARWGAAMQAHRATLLRLLSLLPQPAAAPELDALMAAVVHALSDLVITLSLELPLVLALDDWQWADDASRQVLARICEDFKARRICVLIAMRGSAGEQRVLPKPALELRLRPFTEEESSAVVRSLRFEDAETGLTRALHVRSGGNPLFLEELCWSLPDRPAEGPRALEQSGVPHTLHGVIQARVDTLPPAQTSLLRAAAVIGIEFPRVLLDGALQETSTDAVLDALIAEDLVYREQRAGVFRFKHGITRDVIYESIRVAERRHIHGLVAATIEQGAPSSTDHSEALAYHHRQAGHHEQAASYAELAGDKAMATSSLDRARFHYGAAMAALDQLPRTDENKRRWLAINRKWATPSSYNPARDQLETLERASSFASELDDTGAQAQTSYFRGWFYFVFGDYGRCVQAYEHAMELAASTGDERLEAQLWSTLGQAHAAAGAYDKALPLLIRGIEHRRVRHRSTRPWNLAHALGCKALVHADRGEFAEAQRDIAEASAVVADTGHPMEASHIAHQCMILRWQGLWREAADAAVRAQQAAARTNSMYVLAVSEAFEAHARFMLSPSNELLKQLSRAIAWLEARDQELYISIMHACAAEAYVSAGEFETARLYAMRGLSRARGGDPLGETASYRVLARMHAECATLARAEVEPWLQRALRSGETRGSAREVALTRLLSAELRVELAPGATPHEQALAALAEFERMQMPWHAERARSLTGAG